MRMCELKGYIKNCLSCYIGGSIIRRYEDIYKMKLEDIEDENNKKIIEDFAKILDIEGEIIKKFTILKRLSKSLPENDSLEELQLQVKDFEEDDVCLVILQKIICSLECFYLEEDDEVCNNDFIKSYVLSEMNLQNKINESYDYKEGEEALKRLKNKEKTEKDMKKIVEGLGNIYDTFYFNENNAYNIKSKAECFLKKVERIKRIKSEKKTISYNSRDYFKRVSDLSKDKKKLLLDFLHHIPTNFGYNLKVVMSYKNMTENDIIKLIPGDFNVSKIQELQKNKTRPKEKESENFLLYLCRVLLVSEDVLCLGHGKSYGNWMSVLSKEGLNGLQKAIEKDGEFQEIDSSKRNKIKEFARNEIIQIINDDYEEVIKNNPGFFEEEDFEVYESKEKLFVNIIDKEYAYILLEVLERMD